MKKTMHNPEFTAAALEMEHSYALAAAVRSGRIDADTAERIAREHRAIDRAAARTHRTAETMTAEPLAVGPTAIDRAAVAEHLNERGFSVLARRLERGTTDTAAALDRAAAIERETGADIVSKYIVDQAVKGAARAAHSAENFSGGYDLFRERAQELERETARRHANKAADDDRYGIQVYTAENETIPECYDMVQDAAADIVAAADYMTARGGAPLVPSKARNGEPRAAVETYGRTHKTAADGARRAVRRYAVRAAVETAAAEPYKTAADMGASEPSAVDRYDMGADKTAAEQAAETAAHVGQLAVDVVHIVRYWSSLAAAVYGFDRDDVRTKAPSAVDVVYIVKAAAARGMTAAAVGIAAETMTYMTERTADTAKRAVSRALADIRKDGGAALKAALAADIAARKNGAVLFVR